MMPVSVLGIVSYQVFPAEMGGQKCVEGLYTHLAKKLTVILAVAKKNIVPEGSPFTVLPFLFTHWWGFFNLFHLFRLRRIIREKKISVIIVESSYMGWLGLLLRRLTKVPVVIRSHNIECLRWHDLERSGWRLYEWYEKRVHAQADHSFFITAEDRLWAQERWKLDPAKCSVLTYGTDITGPVTLSEKQDCRNHLLAKYQLPENTKLFVFNGTLNYLPNTDALRIIIREMMPILEAADFPFRIFICGSHLSEQWQKELAKYPALIYAGFVADLATYIKGVDCFINPVTLGGGIKTKLVEALAWDQSVISTRSGARGISTEAGANKLLLVDDYDWPSFVQAMAEVTISSTAHTSAIFYQEFNWDHVVEQACLSLPNNE